MSIVETGWANKAIQNASDTVTKQATTVCDIVFQTVQEIQ